MSTAIVPVDQMELWTDAQAAAIESPEYTAIADEDERFVTWFLGVNGNLDDMETRLKSQYKAMQNAIEMRRMAMARRFGQRVQEAVDRMLDEQGGKKKSISVLTGKAGYRMKPAKSIVTDAKALGEWCCEHCPDALEVVVQRTTPIKAYFESTGEEIPGFQYVPESNEFYPPVSPKAFGCDLWPTLPPQGESE